MTAKPTTSSDKSSAEQAKTIVVCGSLHYDVVVDAPHLPHKDETVTGSSVNYICGGKGGNQAVAAALNGVSTAFIGCVGNDQFGETLVAHLQQHRIDCSELQMIQGASGMSVAIVDDHGDYGAVIVSASNLQLNTNNITLAESTALLMLQNEVPTPVNIALAQQAQALNIPVMLNAAPYRSLPTELIELLDILILNRVEAEQFLKTELMGIDNVVAALERVESPVKNIIVTLGEQGLVYRDYKGQVQQKQAFAITVSSSHGAGDMFCGALASQLIKGVNVDDALKHAMATAAWYVSAPLAERSKLNLTAIDSLLRNA